MKKFKTVTDLEILYAALTYFLDRLIRCEEIAKDLGGDNPFANERVTRAQKRYAEINNEIVRLELEKDN